MEQKLRSKKHKEIKLKQKQNELNSIWPEVPYNFWYLRSVNIHIRLVNILPDSTEINSAQCMTTIHGLTETLKIYIDKHVLTLDIKQQILAKIQTTFFLYFFSVRFYEMDCTYIPLLNTDIISHRN